MADKLSESTWTAFAKKRDLDDAALVKALARFDKTDEAKPDARIEALREVAAQINKQVLAVAKRTKELGDKPAREIKDKLHELLDTAERLEKDTIAAKNAATAAADEEADSPELLTTRMIPLLRELRKGELRMHALITTAGKNTAVLIMRRPIAAGRRKMMAEQVDAKGGARHLGGECQYEDDALTFSVLGPAGGLAKRVYAALLAQTGLRMKVRVQGEDGVMDEDADAVDAPEEPAAGASSSTPPPAPPLPAALAWVQRLPGVRLALDEALKAQHPEATKLRALMGFASEKADAQRDHAAALKALDMLEQLLKAPIAAVSAAAAPAQAAAARTLAPPVVYTQSRLVWGATRSKVQAELQKLEQAIMAHYAGHPRQPALAPAVRQLDRVLALFDGALGDKLDAVLHTEDHAEQQRLHDDARALIARYQGFLANDPLVQGLDANPFVPVTVQAALSGSLGMLAAKLG